MKKKNTKKRFRSKNWRLVIPNLEKKLVKNTPQNFKQQILLKLQQKEHPRGLKFYSIALEKHPKSGAFHLDILMIYSHSILNSFTRYDYLIKHGNLTRYSKLNEAIIKYNFKEDSPLTNFKNYEKLLLQIKLDSSDSLQKFLFKKMKSDPFNFDFWRFIYKNELQSVLVRLNFKKVKEIIENLQKQECLNLFHSKPGIPHISNELIRSKLSSTQFHEFNSWSGYQQIIDFINNILKWGWKRPHKTKNLYLVGRPDTGKTTLLNLLSTRYSTYFLGIKGGWFPGYASNTFKLLRWDEFNLSTYSYPDLLKLLEGIHMTLPLKGKHVLRRDNQLIIATSNLSLGDHVSLKFKNPVLLKQSILNLNARFTQIKIPKSKDLFLIIDLIKSLIF